MREQLGWSYLTAGLMNAANAAGYLVGALACPWLLRRWGARATLLRGSGAAAVLLAMHGWAPTDVWLYALRGLMGLASAAVFVSGGLLAARLASGHAHGTATTAVSPGLVLGIYYGGTGLGIVVSAVLAPLFFGVAVPLLAWAGWRGAWVALAAAAALCTLVMVWRVGAALPVQAGSGANIGPAFRWQPFALGLLSYGLFGLGYIGYMTFIITLLREQQLAAHWVVAFYCLLGLGVMASPWLWASLLQRQRGGGALALLNGLLAVAVALPVASAHPAAAFVSGVLFGSVFLSVVASTTALVRHNLPAAQWPAGISAFTVVFAAGQIAGPALAGALSDSWGGLRAGLAVSAAVLLVAALLARLQMPLTSPPGPPMSPQ